jgi:CelD/BcsL family acetyltransferase involved in cellulose biosynthesis
MEQQRLESPAPDISQLLEQPLGCRTGRTCQRIDFEELKHRRAEWHELAVNSEFPTAFADPAWIMAWWRAYGEGYEPWCFSLEDPDGSLQGLALLACRRTPLARTLIFAGDAWNGIDTLLCAPGAEAELSVLLLDELAARRREWDVWRVRRLSAESCLSRALLDGRGPLRAGAHDCRLQPFLALPEDGAAFESRFGSKQRSTQRRKWRRLLELGASPRLVCDPDEIEPAVAELLALRRSRARAQDQRHAHMDACFERFILDAVRGLMPDGVRLWTLEAGGETLVMRLNLVQGPREHSYLLGLGEDHAMLSPGSSLERHAILEAIAEGRTELDLGPGRDEYKYRLGAIDRELTRLIVPSPSTRGRIVGTTAAIDLGLRNTAAAEVLRRRRGMSTERGSTGAVSVPEHRHVDK